MTARDFVEPADAMAGRGCDIIAAMSETRPLSAARLQELYETFRSTVVASDSAWILSRLRA
jgi:hypothetical protein